MSVRENLAALIQKLLCRLNHHPRLEVIQTFAAAQHIGCPACRREFGIHHGERIVIPWDSELDSLYELMGYEVEAPARRWRAAR
jgi:hypothetical protein